MMPMNFMQTYIMQFFNKMMQNPMALVSKHFDIPQNLKNPKDIVQHLLNSGQINQQQVDQAEQMKSNPMWQMMMRTFGK